MSIINPELYNKIKTKKRLTYSKEIISSKDYSVLGRIKKFFKDLLKWLVFKKLSTYLLSIPEASGSLRM